VETELKFQTHPAHRAALRKAVATASARTTRLQAVYADTADRRLAANGLALRLRKEGANWVQTLKGRGDGLMQRLEHELRLARTPAAASPPALLASRHQGTPAGDRLLALLHDGAPLEPVYRTDIRRLHRRVRHQGALIELAYDRGHILAGSERLDVDEFEFELVRGPEEALLDLAQSWARRFGLWWDVRTKSERGYRLAQGLQRVPAVYAKPVVLPDDALCGQALQQWLANTLEHALPNAAEIAAGTGEPEHLHQLRVALRRLRTVLRLFAAWAPDPDAALALQARWREPHAALGLARDRDVIAAGWPLPPAGVDAPPPPLLPTHDGPGPAELVRGPDFTTLLLQTLALSRAAAAGTAAPLQAQAPSAVRGPVDALWRQVRRGAAGFETASAEQQHRLRKRIKRLRHALEFSQSWMKPKAGARLLRRLRRMLQDLGQLNDMHVAAALSRQQAQADPRAWFWVGLLAARREAALAQTARTLSQLRGKGIPWRKVSASVKP
jgi:triphosphatase